MSKTEEWVKQLIIEEGIISTSTLTREQIKGWWEEYKETFSSDITEESFKRLLRKARWDNEQTIKETPPPVEKPKEEKVVNKLQIIKPKFNVGNVLAIGDLHEPYTREGYLGFCKEMQIKHECGTVVFLGDILDNHTLSFHDTDPDCPHSGIGELNASKEKIKLWHDTFPNAYVCHGNHCSLSDRVAFKAGLSKSWVRSIGEVLDTPTWTYSDEFIFDNVKYCHGIGRQAKQRMSQDLMSCVQGHYHSRSYIDFAVGINHRIFALQVGCGILDKSFAFAYGKHFAKSHINVGIVKDNGTLPILEYMDLDKDYK